MATTIVSLVKMSRANAATTLRRHLSYRGITESVKNYFEPRTKPPYSHVCQIGDPALRAQTQPVDPEIITTPAFQRIVKHMTDVMRTYRAMGLSAPQIGLRYQIIVMELTEKHVKAFDVQQQKSQQIELIPLQVFINPKMKVVDYATLKYPEECVSVLGYSAVVPRVKTVRIEALNADGKPFVFNADGWTARLIQHEMDHLQGKLYIDRMDTNTFTCNFWNAINAARGNTRIQYYPKSWIRNYI